MASLVFADDVQVKMMVAIRALSEARTAMVGVHNELTEAKLRLGIRTSLGGAENKPNFMRNYFNPSVLLGDLFYGIDGTVMSMNVGDSL